MSTAFRRNSRLLRGLVLALVVGSALPLAPTAADARAGSGFSFGSRGSRTFSAPGFTRTAPSGAAPIQRSETPQPGFGSGAASPSFAQPRRFGFGSGLAAGLLGAGLFGMLTGNGFFGGLGGLMSLVGFLVQIAILGGLVVLALRFFRARAGMASAPVFRNGPAYAGGPAAGPSRTGAGPTAGPRPGAVPIEVAPRDFDDFESALVDIQTAFGREDVNALSRMTTSEMLRFFQGDLERNRSRGLHNDVGDVKLLQGDLAEAWREGTTDYATVAMRFSLRDLMVERGGHRIVSGDPARPSEATELWTFRRDGRAPWRLSGIQQAA